MWPRLRQAAVIAVVLLASLLLSQDTATSSGGPVTAPTTQAHRHAGAATDKTVRAAQPDRKSTRLNSSNSQISYAGFCLQKTRSPDGRRDQGGLSRQACRGNHARRIRASPARACRAFGASSPQPPAQVLERANHGWQLPS